MGQWLELAVRRPCGNAFEQVPARWEFCWHGLRSGLCHP